MSETVLLDAAGRRRSAVTLPGYLAGRAPRNKGMSYRADPPRVEEIIAVMREAGEGRHGLRVRGLIVVLWRSGLRISEALELTETDVDPGRGSLLVRHGKGDKRREAGMDDWGFDHLNVWLAERVKLPVGPLFCILDGPTRGRAWAPTAARGEMRALAATAGVRRRFAPHPLRHAHAVELQLTDVKRHQRSEITRLEAALAAAQGETSNYEASSAATVTHPPRDRLRLTVAA